MQQLSELDLVIETQYLPSITYFALLSKTKSVYLEAHENFIKQTYRNRCEILSSQQIESLSVPLIKASSKQAIKEIKIANDSNWQNMHWRSIKTCYGKAPFFEFFADEFHPYFIKEYTFLWDLNLDLLTKCLQILSVPVKLFETNSFKNQYLENVYDGRSLITPKKDDYLKKIYKQIVYTQNFGSKFVPNLSVLDVLMNEGPNASTIVKQSIVDE